MTSVEYLQLKREYAHLRPSDFRASLSFVSECSLSGLGIFLSLAASTPVWLTGQIVLAISMWHWFVILHSCGHHSYFRNSMLNDVAGHWASLWCTVPFFPWRFIHAKHHTWVGWQDIDPTTQGTLPRALPAATQAFINLCWRFWIPVFSVSFVAQTFWNLPRINKLTRRRAQKAKNAFSVILILAVFAACLYAFGAVFLRVWGLAYLIMLVITDPILLSQHVHLPLESRGERRARPFKPFEQDIYSRTLVFPRWIAQGIFLHFNSHTIHHIFPMVPHYHLTRIKCRPIHSFNGIQWILTAKRVPAHRLLFESTAQTRTRL